VEKRRHLHHRPESRYGDRTTRLVDDFSGRPQDSCPAGRDPDAYRRSGRPSGLAVDKNGNLYVADAGNNRVLRYPRPFNQTGQYPVPDLFVGQASISGYGPNYPTGTQTPTAQGLYLNTGSTISSLAFDSAGNLWVLDTGNARVVRFNASSLAGTGGGLTADLELGQPSLTSKNLTALNPSIANSYYNISQFIVPPQ